MQSKDGKLTCVSCSNKKPTVEKDDTENLSVQAKKESLSIASTIAEEEKTEKKKKKKSKKKPSVQEDSNDKPDIPNDNTSNNGIVECSVNSVQIVESMVKSIVEILSIWNNKGTLKERFIALQILSEQSCTLVLLSNTFGVKVDFSRIRETLDSLIFNIVSSPLPANNLESAKLQYKAIKKACRIKETLTRL